MDLDAKHMNAFHFTPLLCHHKNRLRICRLSFLIATSKGLWQKMIVDSRTALTLKRATEDSELDSVRYHSLSFFELAWLIGLCMSRTGQKQPLYVERGW